MKLNEKAEIFLPDGKEHQIERLCFAAHHDDIEFMAFPGIWECYAGAAKFGGVTVSNGSGSPRAGKYAAMTDADMMKTRRLEQFEAARIGKYGVQILLNYTSAEIKDGGNESVTADFTEILRKYRPRIVYTHNPADKHDTHLGVMAKVIKAARALGENERPEMIYGCEVWRGLDWVCDDEKIVCDVSGGRDLAMKLMQVFDSQIAGGKRYDLATDGRRFANATYGASHDVDKSQQACYLIDLTPLIRGVETDITAYIKGFIDRFAAQVESQLKRIL